MDNLLLFIPTKKSHVAKLEDLLKVLLKNGLKISPKKHVSYLEKNNNILGNTIFIKDRKVCMSSH